MRLCNFLIPIFLLDGPPERFKGQEGLEEVRGKQPARAVLPTRRRGRLPGKAGSG